MEALNSLTDKIIGAAIEVHRHKGPGLLESTYESCLAQELTLRNLRFERQVAVPLLYKGLTLDVAFRADMIIENKILIELKALEAILPVHKAQVLSYLRETGLSLGLLINFHVPKLVDGVHRFINDRALSVNSAPSVLNNPAESITAT
ncbi:GxxExxY protein [Rariglobus hedericola]|uniref:GxxExxY protein n=1 Tax=Rariglobus hedericola TaxID=2597822 RepID=A0A556QQN1_9BACT|nr:GxxExxY protein [Rariglobus hedericola]TSJ78942.1 GxxExxY protein [Rariglobus hedericola]